MNQRSDRPTVGHRDVTDRLVAAFEASQEGPRAAILAGSPGSGRKTAVDQLIAALADRKEQVTALRIRALPTDDGVRTLMRVYGALVAGLGRGKGFDEDVADVLEAAGEDAGDERVSGWLGDIASNVRGVRTAASGDFQIKLPRDNPWLALLYAFDVVGPRSRWIIDLQELGCVTSPSFWVFLSALLGRARARNWKVLFLVSPGENLYFETPGVEESLPGPLSFVNALFGDGEPVELPPLTAEQVGELLEDTYRPNSFPLDLTARLHELSGGHPHTLHELLDALEEDDTIRWNDKGYSLSDLDEVDLDVLVPLPVEEDDEDEESDGDEERPDERLLERVLHVAAVEGRTFSAAAVRSVLQLGEDDVDDALDAMPHLVEEGEYHQGLGTWTYRFRYDFWRDWFRDHPPEGFKAKPQQVARGLATVMMQSYAPAAFEYVSRSARLFTWADERRGARNMLGLAVGSDRPELSEFALQVAERFDDSPFPDGLVRLIHTRLADRAVNASSIEQANAAIDRAAAWATSIDDAGTLAWLGLLRCRLGIRQGDFGGARNAGEEALAAFDELGDKTRAGETLNQLAMVALNMGDAKGAEAYVKRADKASNIPPVRAHSQYIHGLLLKRRGLVPQANRCFQVAVELSEQAGNLVLSLEAMLNRGECGMMLGEGKTLAPLLERTLEMSRALRAPTRERIAARLLCQAEAARGNHVAALEMARHALELTREVAKGAGESVDLYHCGLFSVLSGKNEEGLDFLQAARAAAESEGNVSLQPEILFNIGQVKLSQGDNAAGQATFEEALALARTAKDRGRELRILEHLGAVASASGDHDGAVVRFKEAASRAVGPQSKQFRKDLRKRIQAEQRKAAEVRKAQQQGDA